MKAIILCAGKGSRLKNLTKLTPKPMLEINGLPILEQNIRLCKDAGIREILINLHHLPDQITDYFNDGSRFGVEITYSYEEELLGTAGAVKSNEAFFESDFLVLYGDNYSNYDLKEIINFHHQKNADLTIAVYSLSDVSQSGIVRLDKHNKVLEFIEKPVNVIDGPVYANMGVYVLSRPLLAMIPDGFSDFGRDILPMWCSSNIKFFAKIMSEKVLAIDTPELHLLNSGSFSGNV